MSRYSASQEAIDLLAARIMDARGCAERARHVLAARPAPPAPSTGSTGAPVQLGFDVGVVRAGDTQLAQAEAALPQLIDELESFERATRLVGTAYVWADDRMRQLIEATAASLAHMAGSLVRTAAMATLSSLLPGIVTALPVLLIGVSLLPVVDRALRLIQQQSAGGQKSSPQLSAIAARAEALIAPVVDDAVEWATEHLAELLRDPVFGDALRLAIESSDEALEGLMGLPKGTIGQLAAGTGPPDDDSTLRMTLGVLLPGIAAVAGQPQDVWRRPVVATVSKADPPVIDAPVTTLSGGFETIQQAQGDVVIQSFDMPDGTTRWQVFSRGTEDWGLGSEEGLDMTSNLVNAGYGGGTPEGSAAALESAMLQAGIQPGDAVDLFGYSQGGAAAAIVAASGRFQVEHMATYGAPAGSIDVPADVDWVAVVNEQDPVASAGGTYDGSTALIVTADVPAAELGESQMIDGHLSGAYAHSTTRIDASGDPIVESWGATVASGTAGATASTTTQWDARRE